MIYEGICGNTNKNSTGDFQENFRMIQVLIKCHTAEWVDCLTHAIIEFDMQMVEMLAQKLALANRLRREQEDVRHATIFEGLRFRSHIPAFFNAYHGDVGLDKETFNDLEGSIILPAKIGDVDECSIGACSLIVLAGDVRYHRLPARIYWEGQIKHVGIEGRVETYSMYLDDLKEIAEKLDFRICDCGKRLQKDAPERCVDCEHHLQMSHHNVFTEGA